MSEWITDRRPTKEDADHEGGVWDSQGQWVEWYEVYDNEHWMTTNRPLPYVKPKRWVVREYVASRQYFVVEASSFDAPTIYALPNREAAERIAAIYEEVMP